MEVPKTLIAFLSLFTIAMIRFDPKTLSSWKARNITEISCIITDTGCAGHKIQIKEGTGGTLGEKIIQDELLIHIKPEYRELLDNAFITKVGEKWILTSASINTRCGCGSSFSLKSGNSLHDKAARVKLALKQKKEGIHTV